MRRTLHVRLKPQPAWCRWFGTPIAPPWADQLGQASERGAGRRHGAYSTGTCTVWRTPGLSAQVHDAHGSPGRQGNGEHMSFDIFLCLCEVVDKKRLRNKCYSFYHHIPPTKPDIFTRLCHEPGWSSQSVLFFAPDFWVLEWLCNDDTYILLSSLFEVGEFLQVVEHEVFPFLIFLWEIPWESNQRPHCS